jgi:hypothetical protein
MNDKLKELEVELGVTFDIGRITYGSGNASMKLNATEKATDGTTVTPEEIDFKHNCTHWGFKESDLGRKFRSNSGAIFTLTGSSRRRYKMPISAEDRNGKGWKFSPSQVRFI